MDLLLRTTYQRVMNREPGNEASLIAFAAGNTGVGDHERYELDYARHLDICAIAQEVAENADFGDWDDLVRQCPGEWIVEAAHEIVERARNRHTEVDYVPLDFDEPPRSAGIETDDYGSAGVGVGGTRHDSHQDDVKMPEQKNDPTPGSRTHAEMFGAQLGARERTQRITYEPRMPQPMPRRTRAAHPPSSQFAADTMPDFDAGPWAVLSPSAPWGGGHTTHAPPMDRGDRGPFDFGPDFGDALGLGDDYGPAPGLGPCPGPGNARDNGLDLGDDDAYDEDDEFGN